MKLFSKSTNKSLQEQHDPIREEFKKKGKIVGQQNVMNSSPRLLTPYLDAIRSRYVFLKSVFIHVPTDEDKRLVMLQEDALTQQLKATKDGLPHMKSQLVQMSAEHKEVPVTEVQSKNTKWIWLTTLFMSFFEAALLKKSLGSEDNLGWFLQVSILIGLTLIYFIAPHGLWHVYSRNRKNPYLTLILGALVFVVVACLYSFSVLRSHNATSLALLTLEDAPAEVTVIRPIYYFFIQLMLLFSSLYLASLVPTAQDVEYEKDAKNLSLKIKTLERKIQEAEDDVKNIPIRIYHLHEALNQRANVANETEAQVESMYHETVNCFLSECALWSSTPLYDCGFEGPIPSLRSDPTSKSYIPVLLAFITMCIAGCDHINDTEPGPMHAAEVIIDRSDTGLINLEPKEILSLYPFKSQNAYDGFKFRLRYVSDGAENRAITQFELKPEKHSFLDEGEKRIRDVRAFKKNVKTTLEAISKECVIPTEKSLLYETLCAELRTLRESSPQDLTVVLFTDACENSSTFNFYDPDDLLLAQRNPDEAILRFKKVDTLPDLTGVKFYLVFRPRSYTEQGRYKIASGLMKRMLVQKGATVIATPNIIPDE